METEIVNRLLDNRLHELDQQMHLAVLDKDAEEIKRLSGLIVREFITETAEGRELSRLSTDPEKTLRRVLEVYNSRFGRECPPYVFRLQDVARDLIAADAVAAPVPKPKLYTPPEPTADEKFAALVEQVRSDMVNPAVSSAEIRQKRNADPEYNRAFIAANTPEPARQEVKPVTAELKKFAHLLNWHIANIGVPKPHRGFYSLKTADNKSYEYHVTLFREMAEQASAASLLT